MPVLTGTIAAMVLSGITEVKSMAEVRGEGDGCSRKWESVAAEVVTFDLGSLSPSSPLPPSVQLFSCFPFLVFILTSASFVPTSRVPSLSSLSAEKGFHLT